MCLSASTHTVGLHVVPEHQAPHVVLCGASGARFEEVAEETGVVLLEVGLDQLLHLVVDPGAIRVIYQTVIVHTVHLVHPQPGGGEGEGRGRGGGGARHAGCRESAAIVTSGIVSD